MTFSPTFFFRTALPTGEAWLSFPLVGSDSLAPTIWNVRSCPFFPTTLQRHGGTKIHRVFRSLRGIDHPHVAYPALQLTDPALQQALLVLGIIVLGVLRDIPELASLTDAIRDLPAPHIRQI